VNASPERVAPQNLEAEEAVLGALLMAGVLGPEHGRRALEAVTATGLEPADFYRESHGRILAAIGALVGSGDPCDALCVIAELERRGHLEEIGGHTRIHALVVLAKATANAAHHAALVREEAVRRHQLRALAAAEEAVRNGGLGERTQADLLAALRESAGQAAWLERASELLAEPDPGPTPFLVEQLMVEAALAFVVGSWKVGKTWLLLELAISVVSGEPVLGRYPVPEPGPVILVVEESGRAALHRRLDRLARGRAIAKGRLAELHFGANLGVRLNEPRWQRRLREAATAIGPRAVILDPWVRIKGAAVDEKEQREVGEVLDYLLGLREATGAAVITSAHTGHEGGHIRGSSDIEAVWESRLTLTYDRQTKVHTLSAEHREAEESSKLCYRRRPDHETGTLRLEPIDGPEEQAAQNRRETIRHQALRFMGRTEGDPTMTEIVAAVTGKAQYVRAEVEAMVAEGVLERAPAALGDHPDTKRFRRPR
jgi:AAA domain/DnaB-like helicase N terminal domain